MERQPLLICFVALASGIFLQDYFLFSEEAILYVLLLVLFLAIIFWTHWLWIPKMKVITFFLTFMMLAIFLHSENSEKPKLPKFNKEENLVFVLDKKLNSTDKTKRYIIKFDHGSQVFSAVLSVPKEKAELDFAHIYRADVLISTPKSPNNNFQFDYQKYLQRQKIYFQLYLPKEYQFAEKKGMSFFDKMKQNRLDLLFRIDDSDISEESKNFMKGIVLADRTEMSKQTIEDFSRSGLVHLLAISGTHIVIIFWLIMMIFKFLFPTKLRNYGLILSLVLIWAFAWYIGFGNSVVRACIMISVYYGYVLLQRKPDMLHSFSLAGIVILIIDSQQLFNLGFQLSFAAVFGIFWLNQPIQKYLPRASNGLQKIIYTTISVSFSAQLATLPLVLYYFHQYSWISIIANLLIVPCAEIFILFSLLMVILFGLNLEFHFLNVLYDSSISTLLKVIRWFANQEFAFSQIISMNLLEVLFAFCIFYFLRFLLMKFDSKKSFVFSLLCVVFLLGRQMCNVLEAQKSEFIETNYFKNRVLIDKQNQNVVFYLPDNKDSTKIIQQIVFPYLASRRTDSYKIIYISESKINKGIYYKKSEE